MFTEKHLIESLEGFEGFPTRQKREKQVSLLPPTLRVAMPEDLVLVGWWLVRNPRSTDGLGFLIHSLRLS
jgi:hypothetical protein